MNEITQKLMRDVALPKAQGVALHHQLYLVLRDHIRRGIWTQGSPLPTEENLCESFSVSRITVRRALADLQQDGLVERRHGLGTFVLDGASRPAPQLTLSFLDTLRKQAEETRVRVLKVEHVVPPADIAKLLQIEPGCKALHAVRLRLIDDLPVMMTDAWVPESLGRHINASSLRKRALYEVLMAQGVQFGRVLQEITAEVTDPYQAGHLESAVGSPLLKVIRLIHDRQDRPVEHLVAITPSERGRVLMEVPGEQVNTLSAGYITHRT